MCRNPPGSGKCYLPKVSGPFTEQCQINSTNFYFDQEEKQCKEFTYSGCLGNANRFETLGDCEQSCMPTPEDQDLCHQRYEPGPCRYEKSPKLTVWKFHDFLSLRFFMNSIFRNLEVQNLPL